MDILKTLATQLRILDKAVFPDSPAEVIVREDISAKAIGAVATFILCGSKEPGRYIISGKDLSECVEKGLSELKKIAIFIPIPHGSETAGMYIIFGKDLPEYFEGLSEWKEEVILEAAAHEVRHRVQFCYSPKLCLPGTEGFPPKGFPPTLKSVIEDEIQSLPAETFASGLSKLEFDAEVVGKWVVFSRKYEGITIAQTADLLKVGIKKSGSCQE